MSNNVFWELPGSRTFVTTALLPLGSHRFFAGSLGESFRFEGKNHPSGFLPAKHCQSHLQQLFKKSALGHRNKGFGRGEQRSISEFASFCDSTNHLRTILRTKHTTQPLAATCCNEYKQNSPKLHKILIQSWHIINTAEESIVKKKISDEPMADVQSLFTSPISSFAPRL